MNLSPGFFAGFLVLALNLSCSSPKAILPTAGYALAYNVFAPELGEDNWELFRIGLDGSENRNLTQHPDVAWTYLAVGQRLFFISDRDTCHRCYFLYECDANGGNVLKISDLQLEDSWMDARNSGTEMVVIGRRGDSIRYQPFILNTENGAFRQLLNVDSLVYLDPCFSPDGSQIVMAVRPRQRRPGAHEELFLLDSAGVVIRQLTTYPPEDPSLQEYGYKAGTPHWHPTENFISYVSVQGGRTGIYAVTPDGSRQWKLFDTPDHTGWHSWSPDGKWLAYDQSNSEQQQYHIMLMNWSTRESIQLTDTTHKSQLAPVWVKEK